MSAISRDQLDDIHALSPVQQGMFFHAMLEPELAPYVTQGLWRIRGVLVPALFERAWNELVTRHTVLRSVFRQARRQPVQIVLKQQSIGIAQHDWTSLAPDAQRRALSELARSEHAPFSLADGPLFRLALVRFGTDEWRLLWTFHHIILDGLTVGLLLDSLCTIYDAVASGQPLPPADAAPFSRFVVWLAQQDHQESMRFWTGQLEGFAAPTPLPYDRRPTSVAGRAHRVRHVRVSRDTTRALEDLARRHRVTISRLVYAAWALLLSRYSGEPDVVFGLTLAGRPADVADVERIAGPFINTVPVRVSLSGDPRLADVLQALQRQFFEIEPFSHVSVADIQGRTSIRPPAKLFDSALNVHPPVDWNGFRSSSFVLGLATEEGPPVGRTNYDLMVDVALFETIGITISYVEEVFDAATVVGMLASLRTLLDAIAARGADVRVSELDLVSPEERTRLLDGFNPSDPAGGFDGGVVARIEAQAARTPEATALVAGDTRLGYEALNAGANQVACWLRAAGIGREDRVGVFGERGAELVEVVLGILKAGAAFVPLDPLQPDARLASIVSSSGVRIIACGPDAAARALTLTGSMAQAPALVCWGPAPAGVVMQGSNAWADLSSANPPRVTAARDLACVFFTSGSTGAPKGVMVEHAGMLNHHAAKIAGLGIDASSIVAQNAALGFDVSVWQMLASLECGGRVVMYDDETAIDAVRLVAGVARDGITILETVPTLLDPIIEAARAVELPSLRVLVSNAELLPVPLCRRWLERFPHVPVVNTYGATECSDDTTHHVQRDVPGDDATRIAVGRPIPGARIYVVDQALRPVPSGASGQIAMAGVPVGRGYLDDPVGTAHAFVPDPYSAEAGARLYLSGDTGRWTRDGVLEFLGRDGDQVKVRGHRVELGEIQAALLAYDGVHQAAAAIGERAPGDPQVLAYWVGEDHVDPAQLRAWLGAVLPAHMLPAALVRLEALPLTTNGKVDRRALPIPSTADVQTSYVAPHDPIEIQVADIWREVLGVERVGATDNFFELGGQSLKTLQIRLRLVEAFGVDIPMRAVFRHQTVRAQAQAVAEALETRTAPFKGIPRLPEADTYALSRAQRRLWFVHQLDPTDTSYNLLEPLSLEGTFDLGAFERAWSNLIARHESLRTMFLEVDGEPVQRIAPPAAVRLPHLDLAALSETARALELKRVLTEARETPFTLETPPVRALVVTLAPERHLFAVALHHLVSDGWSGDVLLREFLDLYRAARTGEEPRLRPLPIRYVDYAAWQNERIATGGCADDEQYWIAKLSGELPALNLGSLQAAPSAGGVHTVTFAVDAETAHRVRRATADRDVTPFMVRMALVKAALARISGADDLLIGSPVAGRDRPETDALVGFFVNLLAFRTSLDGDLSFLDVVARVRQSCLDAYAHQDYPFDELVQRLNPARAASRAPIFDVLFTTFASGEARTVEGLTIAELAQGPDRAMVVWPGANMAVALFVICREEPDGALSWMLVFDAQRVDRGTAERVTARFEAVVRALARHPQARLSTIPVGAASDPETCRLQPFTDRDEYPLSLAQHDVWTESQLRPGSALGTLTIRVALDGTLDERVFAAAVRTVTLRHAAFGLTFGVRGGAPYQRSTGAAEMPVRREDMTHLGPVAQQEAVRAAEDALARAAFDLSAAPLARAALLRLGPDRHVFLLAWHRLVADAPRIGELLESIGEAYARRMRGAPDGSHDPAVRPTDVAIWQDARRASGHLIREANYWRRALTRAGASALPPDRPPKTDRTFETATLVRAVAPGTVRALRSMARKQRTTLVRIVVSALGVLTARLTRERDVALRVAMTVRPRGAARTIGPFVHDVPIDARVIGDRSFDALLADVTRRMATAHDCREFAATLDPVAADDAPRRPAITVISHRRKVRRAFGDLEMIGGIPVCSASPSDLSVAIAEDAGGIELHIAYAAELFEASTIERWTSYLVTLLEAVAAQPAERVDRLPLLPARERDLIVREWNTTATAFPVAATVHALVEARAAQAPDALAVIHGDERWTYRDINERANRLARHLLAAGVEPGTLVGTLLERSSDLVVAQLAILKAGAAYLSLTPDDPLERIRFMLADGGVRVAIATPSFHGDLSDVGDLTWVMLDRDGPAIAALRCEDLASRGDGSGLSHVMYTSGSTGRPKGVMIPHRGITRLVCDNPDLTITPADRVAQMANCLFDGITLEIWGALVNGACLVIIPRETVLSPAALAAAIAAHDITVASLTPVLFNQMARETPACFGRMKYVFSGGDVMSPAAARQVLTQGAPEHLINGYGPTENSMFTTCHLVTRAAGESTRIPIGRPVSNTRVYIVDAEMEPAGIGVPGELCTGGAGLADGYRGRPALTAERFIPDPFSGASGSRLYCTGDLARWLTDGSIEFLGRTDHQVKIRGHRIELGEVEAVLMEHDDVAEAVVVLRENSAGDRHLAAYVVPAPGRTIAADAVRRFASARLPGYMVPTWVVPRAALPLTPARKVDRQALPAPTDDRAALGVEYAPPRTAIEAQIAETWSDVLGRADVGTRDNFFDLGGHSLTTVLIRSRLCERFQIDLPLRAVFEHQTVEAQAGVIEALLGSGTRVARAPIPRLPDREHYRLSHAQRRLWFLQRLHPDDTTYTVFVPVPLDGPLDERAFAVALDGLVARHAALRTSFALAGQEPVQCVSDEFRPRLRFHDLSALEAGARRERSRAIAEEMGGRAFDLATPPVRTALVKLSSERHLFYLALHHSLTDGWSWRVLVRDLAEMYRAACHGEEPRLEPLPVRYVDYAAWQNERIESGALATAERYWLERLADAPPALELPDGSAPEDPSIDEMRTELFTTDAGSVERLHRLGQARELTPLMARLALVEAFLARATGQEDLVIGVPVAGRDHPDTEGLAGFFVNILPMRTNVGGDPTFLEVLDRVKQTCLDAYTHQEYPFDLLVQRLNPSRDPEQLPLVQAIFTSDQAAPPVMVENVTVGAYADLPVGGGGTEWRGTANGIRITCFEQGARLVWSFAYPASRLSVESARRLMRQFAGFIEDTLRLPARPLSQLDLRSEYGLSAAQRDVWRDCRSHPGAAVAAASIRVVLRGPLDADRWRLALQATIDRADALRAVFHESDGAVLQQIVPHAAIDLPLVDLASMPEAERDGQLQQLERDLARQPFDVASAPLVRAVLVRVEEAEHVCLVSAHRLVIDAGELPRLAEEIARAYEGAGDPRPAALEYADFVAWEEGRARSGMLAPHAQHWRRQLQAPLPAMALPADRLTPASRTFEVDVCRRHLDPGVAAALASRGHTVQSTLVAVFAVLVARLTGQTEVLAGLRVSACPKRFDGLLGTFAHTLPLRMAAAAGRPFEDLVRDADARLKDAQNRREATLAGGAAYEADGPVFTIAVECVRLLDGSIDGVRMLPGLPVWTSGVEELTLVIVETSDGVDLALRYPIESFDARTIARWTDYLVAGLARAAVHPEHAIGRLDLLPDADREWLVHGVNAAAAAVTSMATVHALVGARAAQAPDAPAVIHGDERWTYGDIDARANRLARYLAARGVEPGTLVGTFLERSPDLIVAQLAILKAGAAYLPLSTDDPAERLGFMLADSRARVAITTEALGAGLAAAVGLTVVVLDRDAAAIAECSCVGPPVRGDGNSLAYVMYTSGSTGRPKGVMIPHRGITRLVRDTTLVTIAPDDRVSQIANCSFDAATFEVWGALVNGACLVSFPHETVISPRELAAGFEAHGVTIGFFTAALFGQMALETPASFRGMRHLLTGGDVMNPRAGRLILEHGAPRRLSNGYGPTENSVFTTEHTVTLTATEPATVPIGRPVSNTQVYIVDAQLQPVGVGMPGELCTGGAGLADGYWGRPTLTAERFIPDPFGGAPGARLYCTGDLARWRGDGSIEFLGRGDQQVKIRGHRVELGEIEAVLRQHDAVADAVVVMRDRGAGARGLTGYIVPAPGATIAPDALRRYVGTRLPRYMVPTWIVPLSALPLAATGKVDRRALPAPDDERAALGVEPAPPRDALEAEIAAVWREVLGVERVGVHDNFFDLGGDSVQCIVAVSHLAERGIHTTPKRFYAHSTVAGLAAVVEHTSASALEHAGPVSGPVPLLPIQHFFFEQELESAHHWNAGTLLRADRLDAGAVERALQAILDRHDALRMRFSHGPDGWTQHNPAPGEAVSFEVVDLGDDAARLTFECTRVQASLDFTRGPVFRGALFRLADGTDRLLLVAHHLVSDMVSGRILYEDLPRAYDQALRGTAVELRARTTSYQRWGQILEAHAPERLEELPYWQWVVEQAAPSLPIDQDLGANSMESVDHVRVELDAETTHTLLTRARQTLGLEMHDLLLAAMSRALGEWAGVPALAFLVEGHGREDIVDGIDLSRTVGWFTAMYPVRLETGRGMALEEHLRRVLETLHAVPNRGLGYGLLRYMLRRPEIDGRPHPEVSFNYHGQFSVPPGSRFGLARESAGQFTGTRGRRFSLLNAECWVGSGRVRAAFLYSRHKHRAETLTAILERFAQELRAIADLCLATPPGADSPSRRASGRERVAGGV